MQIDELRRAGIVILRPIGRIDHAASDEFHTRLVAAVGGSAAGCILDMSGVPYIASSGMRAIIAAARAKPAGGQFAVAAPSPVVREVFKVARFAQIVPVFETVESAEGALGSP